MWNKWNPLSIPILNKKQTKISVWLLSVKSCLLTNNYVFYVLFDEINVFNVRAPFNLLASYDLCVKTVATCIFFFTIFWIISKLNIHLITHNHFLKNDIHVQEVKYTFMRHKQDNSLFISLQHLNLRWIFRIS